MPVVRRDVAAIAAIAGSGPAGGAHSLDVHHIDIRWLSSPSGHPKHFLTLDDLSFEYDANRPNIQLNSPRSVFVLLRNGLSVDLVTAVNPENVKKQSALEGLSEGQVLLRIDAENERRLHRLSVVRNEYNQTCEEISREELVEKIRSFINESFLQSQTEQHQIYRMLTNSPKNIRSMKGDCSRQMSDLSCAPLGPRSLHYIDDACAEVVGKARERTVADVRRILRQAELRTQQQAAREHLLHESEAEAIDRTRELREREREMQIDHHELLRRKDRAFRKRLSAIKEREKMLVGEKAESIQTRDSAVTARIAAIKAHRKKANVAVKEERKNHRELVKKKDEEQQHRRREQLINASDEARRKHDETVARRREETLLRSHQKAELSSTMQASVIEAQQLQKEQLELRRNAVEKEAEERYRAFQKRREERLQAQRAHSEQRANKSKFSREMAEQRHNERLKTIETHYNKKIETVESIKRERDREGKIQKEALCQMRASKKEEQQRVDKASVFAFLGYMNDNAAKSLSVQHERQRRDVLTNHVRSERDALMRAMQRTLGAIEAENAVRMKDECLALNQL